MRLLPFHLLTIALLCSCAQNSDNYEDRYIPYFGFSEADEIEEFYDASRTIKKPVFPGGNDSLRCYLAKNIRYNEKLFNPETPNYLTIEYNVGPDCSISFPQDCIIGKEAWPVSIELLYYNSEEALDSMIEEAKRVIGNLKYKKIRHETRQRLWRLDTDFHQVISTYLFQKKLRSIALQQRLHHCRNGTLSNINK